jgi:hypothetical protein
VIDPAWFTSLDQLTRWQQDLDRRGLRATGSPEHAAYVEDLTHRLIEAGVSDVRLEAIPLRRWTATRAQLEVDEHAVPLIAPVVTLAAPELTESGARCP